MSKTKDSKHKKSQTSTPPESNKDARIKDLESKLARALADYHNLERRFEKESRDIIKFANKNIITELINIKDNLERAHSAIRDKGLEMILTQITKLLQSEGVVEIDALNKEFDPTNMEVDSIVEGERNKVMSVVLKGYMLHDRVLRPAKVKVGSGTQSRPAPESSNNTKSQSKK